MGKKKPYIYEVIFFYISINLYIFLLVSDFHLIYISVYTLVCSECFSYILIHVRAQNESEVLLIA